MPRPHSGRCCYCRAPFNAHELARYESPQRSPHRPTTPEPDLTIPFVPCVVVLDDPKRTEMTLRDCPMVWVQDSRETDLGYDMETGELVCIRIYGDVSQRRHVDKRPLRSNK